MAIHVTEQLRTFLLSILLGLGAGTITAITVVTEVFHFIDTTSAVEIDVTRRFIILVKWV